MAELLTPGQRKQIHWLRFKQPMEREFREEYAEKSLNSVRTGLGTAIFVTFLFGFGFGMSADMVERNRVLAFAVVLPILLTGLALTFGRFYRYISQPLNALICIAILVMVFLADLPYSASFYGQSIVGGVIGMLACTFMLARLRFPWAVGTGLIMLVMYIYLVYGYRPIVEPNRSNATIWVFIVLIAGSVTSYLQERYIRREFLFRNLLDIEKRKSENILSNVLPQSIAEQLRNNPGIIAESHQDASVLFADIVEFTPFAASRPSSEVVGFLNDVFSKFDALVEQYELEKIKTVGDAYMVAGGIPHARSGHLQAICNLALAMREAAQSMGTDLRIGIHTGSLVAGVIGTRKYLYDLWGDTVNTASRMESHGMPGCIQVTAKVVGELGDTFEFEERGEVEVKGIGLVQTYWLIGRSGSDVTETVVAQKA